MNGCSFSFCGHTLLALASGALFWPAHKLLVVSDLHFGKSARLSAVGGAQLPPYDTRETLTRLETDLTRTAAQTVICLGDSFDTPQIARALPEQDRLWVTKLQAGRRWVWIEGNHDPGPVGLGGEHLAALHIDGMTFRHIAEPDQIGDVSGHYHPKARLSLRGKTVSRPCFLIDETRIILPAYGAFTGGLRSDSQTLCDLMRPDAKAILTGPHPGPIPMPRK